MHFELVAIHKVCTPKNGHFDPPPPNTHYDVIVTINLLLLCTFGQTPLPLSAYVLYGWPLVQIPQVCIVTFFLIAKTCLVECHLQNLCPLGTYKKKIQYQYLDLSSTLHILKLMKRICVAFFLHLRTCKYALAHWPDPEVKIHKNCSLNHDRPL